MNCVSLNSKGNPCGNKVVYGRYCAWHQSKPVSKKKPKEDPKKVPKKRQTGDRKKPQSVRASEIQRLIYKEKGQNVSKHANVNELTVLLYDRLFPIKGE